MEELFTIAVSLGEIVHNRGFTLRPKHPRYQQTLHHAHTFLLFFSSEPFPYTCRQRSVKSLWQQLLGFILDSLIEVLQTSLVFTCSVAVAVVVG